MRDPDRQDEDAPRLLRLADVAERLGVSYRSVQAWVATGRVRVLRLSPRVVRVEASELERLLREARR